MSTINRYQTIEYGAYLTQITKEVGEQTVVSFDDVILFAYESGIHWQQVINQLNKYRKS